jgi:hypothetical protein
VNVTVYETFVAPGVVELTLTFGETMCDAGTSENGVDVDPVSDDVETLRVCGAVDDEFVTAGIVNFTSVLGPMSPPLISPVTWLVPCPLWGHHDGPLGIVNDKHPVFPSNVPGSDEVSVTVP